MFTQDAPGGLEVALATAAHRPTLADVRRAWNKRQAGRATPVLLVVIHPDADGAKASLCGPTDRQFAHRDLDPSQVERLADHALSEPTHHAATRFLLTNLPEVDSPLPGVRNVGLLATQELRAGVPLRADWPKAVAKSTPLLSLRGKILMERLGFGVEPLASHASMLTINGQKRAVGVFCDDTEPFQAPSRRFGNISPVSRALAIATRENVDWVIITRSAEIRLYAARPNTGVGRKSQTETFVEINLALLPRHQSGYLHLLFSARALDQDGTIEEILAHSADFAADLAVRLRERVYNDTVPLLSQAVAKRMGRRTTGNTLTEEDLASAYELVMVILFRLLFVAYSEDMGFLPYRQSDRYTSHSLSRIVQLMTEDRRRGKLEFDREATDLWDSVNQLWRVIDRGNITWEVPAYDGGLFSTDPEVNPSAEALDDLRLTDAEFGPALAALLIDRGPEGEGPVDFRSLSVREFGTIYEGLLESRLSVAQSDLTLNKKGEYIPTQAASKGKRPKLAQVVVPEGTVYLHNRSGVRKATGSYFTKPFAVEHLLDHALEVALLDHLARLDTLREAGDEAALSEAFFDFRCADIAMGSGHFLVAAVDRIEARLSDWLDLHPVPSVVDELGRLRNTALEALRELADGMEINPRSLLRRQVARHCIYGVDKNRIAVELARLAIWVHTFVPGLPLSFLDHNLVCGDSLTGVGTLDEVTGTLDPKAKPGSPSLPRSRLETQLAKARGALRRLAHTSDASKREIDEARAAHQEAQEAVAPARKIFDVVTAIRAGACQAPYDFDDATIAELRSDPEVAETIRRLNPMHFPAAFPEVFIRERPGFDCLLGNPPWEQVVVKEQVWWGMHLPGIRGLPIKQMNDAIAQHRIYRPDLETAYQEEETASAQTRLILRATFSKMGAGFTDLYKAFSWRNWELIRSGAVCGLVLPRSILQTKGSEMWRKKVLDVERERERANLEVQMSVCTLINHRGWVFDGIHNSYTVALVAVRRSSQPLLASTRENGRSTGSTAATHSPSSPSVSSPFAPTRGGGFEEAQVAIYPGPASSLAHFRQIIAEKPELVPVSEFAGWSDTASFPQVPNRAAFRVWRKMNQQPHLVPPEGAAPPRKWTFRPVQGDLNATSDKHRFILDRGASTRWRNSTPPPTNTGSFSTVESPPAS